MTWAESGCTVTARLNWTCCWPLESPFDDWCEPSLLQKKTHENSTQIDYSNFRFLPFRFAFDQMISSSKRDKMRVISRRRYRHRTRATHIRMTQLISQRLQFISRKMIIIPKNVIMRRSRRSLDSSVRTEIKIVLSRMCDRDIDGRSRRDIAAFTALFLFIWTE